LKKYYISLVVYTYIYMNKQQITNEIYFGMIQKFNDEFTAANINSAINYGERVLPKNMSVCQYSNYIKSKIYIDKLASMRVKAASYK
jgi:hypothetical protein